MINSFSYRWFHIPTGKSGISSIMAWDEDDFLTKLERWNESLPTQWKYTNL